MQNRSEGFNLQSWQFTTHLVVLRSAYKLHRMKSEVKTVQKRKSRFLQFVFFTYLLDRVFTPNDFKTLWRL